MASDDKEADVQLVIILILSWRMARDLERVDRVAWLSILGGGGVRSTIYMQPLTSNFSAMHSNRNHLARTHHFSRPQPTTTELMSTTTDQSRASDGEQRTTNRQDVQAQRSTT